MNKKIAIVTGANTGLGYAASLGLAKEGYKVIMACRSADKANDAIAKIKRKVSTADLEYIQLDLVDRDTIKAFAETYASKHDHLNVLLNNAGVMGPPHTITQNGLELQLDANHMGHFYLTYLLMDALDQSYETRVVNVSSIAGKSKQADIYFDNINFEGNYNEGPSFMGVTGMTAYSQSKFANILFTMALKDRLEKAGKHIKAVAAHPGVSNTDLSRNFPAMIRFLVPILSRVMNISQPAEGAQSLLVAALDASVQAGDFIGPTGKGEATGKPGKVKLPEKAHDKALSAKFWAFSESELGIQFDI
ncbi:MAG: oxidoreductase [Chloroflexota bacterium]